MYDDDHPRLTFRLDPATLTRVQQLAHRHNETVSQLCRDALALLLANPAPYLALLSQRVLEHHAMPTDAQAAAGRRYIAYQVQAFDPAQIIAEHCRRPAHDPH